MYFETMGRDAMRGMKGRLKNASSLMTSSERSFLNGIIGHFKPKKILEIGVAAGASSAIILNAIKDVESAKLYSVDLSTRHCNIPDESTGFAVNRFFPELAPPDKWELKTGKLTYEFIDEIGDGIDCCVIDTVHKRPGEILDYLMVLPYLSDNCVVVIHDTAYHTFPDHPRGAPCSLLFSCIKGQKYSLMERKHKDYLPNIGTVVCDGSPMNDSFSIFNLLSLDWEYGIKRETIASLRDFFSRHYSERELYWFDMCYSSQLSRLRREVTGEDNKPSQAEGKTAGGAYPLSKKIKAYALFPWYLYRSLKS